jgi:ribosomal protein S18 acetylase RimI-like enzyme
MARAGMLAAPLRIPWAALGRISIMEEYAVRLHRRHAPDRHWYLSQLGVEPERQGQGVGSALVGGMLSRIEADHLLCYLETANAANLAFYRRHGFQVVADGTVKSGGVPSEVHLWAMLRPPSASGAGAEQAE